MPAWEPGRSQPHLNQPGNPLGPQPSLRHPAQNPSGLLPGTPSVPRGVEAWSDQQFHRFASDGTNQVWTWQTPVFDLRPGLSSAYGNIPEAVPINHEGALGMSVYLTLIVGEQTGTVPPASAIGWTAEYWEVGNAVQAQNPQLQMLTQIQDVTETLLEGGTTTVAPFGASPFSFTPCVPGLRFWQLNFRLTQAGVIGVALPYFIQSSLH